MTEANSAPGLKRERLARGLSPEQLGEMAGVDVAHIHNLERGESAPAAVVETLRAYFAPTSGVDIRKEQS
jgi:transcriptional regulator with XRE-family HTH domain